MRKVNTTDDVVFGNLPLRTFFTSAQAQLPVSTVLHFNFLLSHYLVFIVETYRALALSVLSDANPNRPLAAALSRARLSSHRSADGQHYRLATNVF